MYGCRLMIERMDMQERSKIQEGSVAIEFALVLPVFLILLFGIIEFSTLFYDKAVITNASREGARVGVVYRYDPVNSTPPTEEEIIEEVTETVTETIDDNLISFGSGSTVNTDVSLEGIDPGDLLTVTVSYKYDFLFLPNFITDLTGGVTLTATTVMQME